MVMAYIWTGMVLTAVLFSFWSGAGGVLSQAVLEGAQAGVTLTLSMAGGGMPLVRRGTSHGCAGLNRILARFLGPVICRLFPSSRKDPKVGELVSANLYQRGGGGGPPPGGGAASQRMGRYAKPGEASHEMCRLIVMNTASIQLIPANVAAVRAGLVR